MGTDAIAPLLRLMVGAVAAPGELNGWGRGYIVLGRIGRTHRPIFE